MILWFICLFKYQNCPELILLLRLLSIGLLSWEIIDSESNKEPKIDPSFITDYLPNIAYFFADFYEKFYDESITALTNQIQATPAPSTPLLLTSPKLLTTSPLTSIGQPSASAAQQQQHEPPSQSIVLKISTRKLEIISSLKEQIIDNELCSCIYIYLIIACFELNDWSNLKVLLPSVKYPNNNVDQFEKWFIYLIITILNDKHIIEQFRNEWFVSLVFDEFFLPIISSNITQIQHLQKDDPQQQQQQQSTANSTKANQLIVKTNLFYEQIYKLIDKLYPTYLNVANFTHLTELLKPNKIVSFI